MKARAHGKERETEVSFDLSCNTDQENTRMRCTIFSVLKHARAVKVNRWIRAFSLLFPP